MKTVTESIYSDTNVCIAMALVQHIETTFTPQCTTNYGHFEATGESKPNGIIIITELTKWNFENDCWENPIFIPEENKDKFFTAFGRYRNEVEANIIEPD